MQTTLSCTLRFLEENDIEDVLSICNKQLGEGFLNETMLRSYLNNPQKFCQVIALEDRLAGFSLMEISPLEVVAKKMKSEEQWFLNFFEAYPMIGYRSLTAVGPEYEGRGVASRLVEEGLQFLSRKVAVVVCDAWKSEYTHIGNVLQRNGYEALREVPHFWTAESINQQYDCEHCGPPPCECTAVIYAKFFEQKGQQWWERKDLCYREDLLHMGQVNISEFVRNKETPLYIYDVDRIVEKYHQLSERLKAHSLDFCIYYAMKANRHPAILTHLKVRTDAGIDVCSPRELEMALQYGFREEQISYTGTSLSDKDLKVLMQHPNIRINFDSLSSVRRFAKMGAQRSIGIRINPGIGMAYNPGLEYAGNSISKFGIYHEQWAELKSLIDNSGLTIDRVHCHCGSGFLTSQLERLPFLFDKINNFLKFFPDITTLNLGGGLGVPQNKGDQLLNTEQWASFIADYVRGNGLKLAFEPGDYLVKDAGVLITEVNTVEQKAGKIFIGLDCGMNVNNEYAYYKMNLEAVPLIKNEGRSGIKATLCGNINEPVDLFAEDKQMSSVEEGDYLALLNSGGYGASSSSNHCMRGDFKEYIISK
jgi:diaminopimelate decarboxylase